MARQLLKHIDILATMEDVPDDAGTICGRELEDAAIIIDEHAISSVGPTSELADDTENCDETDLKPDPSNRRAQLIHHRTGAIQILSMSRV